MASIIRFLNRDSITILMLHGIAGDHPEAGWQPLWPRMSPEQLDTVMKQLSAHYHFIPLADAVEIIAGRKQPVRNGLVLTFDDGYRNNVREALPVLKKYKAPATFYVATGFVETGRSFWIDRLDYALQSTPDPERLLHLAGQEVDLRNLDRSNLSEGYRQLRLHIKESTNSDEQLNEQVQAIGVALEQKAASTIDDIIESDPFVAIATWEELGDSTRSGVEIGSHTVDHLRLTAIPASVVEQQLQDSQHEIERQIGTACRNFCYPNGDCDDSVAQQVRNAGFDSAVTVTRGLNRIGDDLMTLRRFPMPANENEFSNLLTISGFMELPVVGSLVAGLG